MTVAGGVFDLIGLVSFLPSLPPPCTGFCPLYTSGGWLFLSMGLLLVGTGLVIVGFWRMLESRFRRSQGT